MKQNIIKDRLKCLASTLVSKVNRTNYMKHTKRKNDSVCKKGDGPLSNKREKYTKNSNGEYGVFDWCGVANTRISLSASSIYNKCWAAFYQHAVVIESRELLLNSVLGNGLKMQCKTARVQR